MKLFNIKHLFTVPSLLNICGIAIAVAAFYVIMAVVDFDLTYNHSIKDCENIYNLSISWQGNPRSNIVSRPIGEAIGREMPSVVDYGCLNPWVDWSLYAKRNEEYNKLDIRTGKISRGLIPTFDIKILEGDTTKFVNEKQIIISRQNAQKYGIHVGEYLKYDLNSRDEVEVVAIYDIAPNTELKPFGAFRCIGDEYIDNDGWSVTTYYYKTYTRLDETTTKDVLATVVKRMFHYDEMTGADRDSLDITIKSLYAQLSPSFTSLDGLHFATELDGFHEPANAKIVYTLLILAIVIILIAYINYVNFFFARVPQRIKSINTMKILGSSRQNLVMMLVGESLIFTLVSMALAYLIVHIFAPTLVGGAVDLDTIVYPNHKILAISILIPILTSVLVSIYPALHITNVPPALAIKGNVTQTHDFALRYILIGFQIVASTVLIIASMFIHKNIEYITGSDIGFNRRNLYSVETSQNICQQRDEVRSLLLQNPDIIDVTWTHSELIARMRHSIGFELPEINDKPVKVDVIFAADNFFEFMGIEIEEGRGFSPSDHKADYGVYVFSETARNTYGLTLEKPFPDINGMVNTEIAGFCKDIKFKPLHYAITPLAFYIPAVKDPYFTDLLHLYIRFADGADVKKTSKYIEESLAKIDPDFPFMNHPVKSFQSEMLDSCYVEETHLTRLVTVFAFIAILISVMGIFGIVYFETERRRKEIGIRRVNGATVLEILAMFNLKFLKITAVCSAIAIPIAYILVQKYFSGFAFHYAINAWIFALAVLITVAVTALVVTAASFKAANENPVKTLKNE